MQVKKFEAKSMKDALQLVKQELGPDAIILGFKDNKKFGLVGRGSIEVTAAISERSMQKRQFAESRLPTVSKEGFRSKSAKHQKAFIENTVNRYKARHTASSARVSLDDGLGATRDRASQIAVPAKAKPVTRQRYIDIGDEELNDSPLTGRRVDDVLEEFGRSGRVVLEDAANKAVPQFVVPKAAATSQVENLKAEVEQLKSLLRRFQEGDSKRPVTQHPGAEFGLPFELSPTFEKLQSAGVDTRYIVEILEKADRELSGMEKKKRSLVDAWVARSILSQTHVVDSWTPPEETPALHLFTGPSGHGKTQSLVKIASRYVLQDKKRIAVFTADTVKVGAAEQLKIYSQILNVPFETVKHSHEFYRLMTKYSGFDAILVDYPGFALKDISEVDQLRSVLPPREMKRINHLVISCTAKDIDAYEAAQRYNATLYQDIIVTKVDESFAHGLLFNIQRKTNKPLYAFGVGPKIPEDVELATRERVLDLIFKITKN
ncbi:MAG: flagellar biosynthesis protein FlhF [Oligoflexia bacterium]|nr:flagellar biosynthesis protein FlhF [Oligoflexia bacterium]